MIADVTGDFVYARLQTGSDDIETAYAAEPTSTSGPAGCRTYARGGAPADLPKVDRRRPARNAARRLRLRHPRGQGPRPGRGHGPAGARGRAAGGVGPGPGNSKERC